MSLRDELEEIDPMILANTALSSRDEARESNPILKYEHLKENWPNLSECINVLKVALNEEKDQAILAGFIGGLVLLADYSEGTEQ